MPGTAQKPRDSRAPTDGAKRFAAFLTKNHITKVAASKALNVSDPTIYDWTIGTKRPKAHHRDAIAVWTRNEVPVESWRRPGEKRTVTGVVPFEAPSSTSVETDANASGLQKTAANDDAETSTSKSNGTEG